ncbi:MAG: hypothetical protein IJ599_01935, partial [Alphaproteobacteria bacterium]|nr:hypothetical protein [Alphaproteobacteria bacterium]
CEKFTQYTRYNHITLHEMLRRCAAEMIREVCPANHAYVSENVSPAHTPVQLSTLPHLSVSKVARHINVEYYGEKPTD